MSRVRYGTEKNTEGHPRFFLVCLSHDNLVNHYKTNFGMMQHHNYSLTELENMMPFEREVYVALLVEHLKEEKERHEQEERQRQR